MKRMTAIVDFEASSLWGGYPIEVGIALIPPFEGPDTLRKIVSSSHLIRHEPWLIGGYWDPRAQEVHGIRKSEIDAQGKDPLFVSAWMNDVLADCDVYADSDFDNGWNAQLFGAANTKPTFKLNHIRDIFDGAAHINDHCVVNFINGPAHRAGADAERIARTVAACIVRPQDLPPQKQPHMSFN